MNTRKKINILVACALLSSGCAKFVPPTGGAKDEIGPILIKTTTESKTKNFKGQEIDFIFDEPIETNSLRQELVITPAIEGKYQIKSKNEQLSLQFDKPFAANTTYTLNLRKGVKDLTEGNASKEIKLVFSTGSSIDSLKIDGLVNNLFTGKPIFDALVGIYSLQASDTIQIDKRKPSYFVKTDSSGKFQFENIKANTYILRSFTDKNNNLLFDEKTEWLGQHPDTLELTKNVDKVVVNLHPYEKQPPKVRRFIPQAETYTIRFDKSLREAKVEALKRDSVQYRWFKEDLIIYRNANHAANDTLKVNVTVSDSSGNKATYPQSIYYLSTTRSSTPQLLKIVQRTPSNRLLREPHIQITFDQPITTFDTTKLMVLNDTLKAADVSYEWKLMGTQLHLKTKPNNSTQKLTIKSLSGAFKSGRDSTSAFELVYNLATTNRTGTLAIEMDNNKKGVNYIVQLLDADSYELIVEEFTTSSKLKFELLSPATYIIRIIEDRNNNKQWDSGDYRVGEKPERVIVHPQRIRVRENFDIEGVKVTL